MVSYPSNHRSMDRKDADRDLIYLSSKNGNVVNGSYFSTTLTKPINRVKEVEVVGVCTPFTWYNITNGTNIIYIHDDETLISIPPGSYTSIASLIAAVNSQVQYIVLSIVGNKFVLTSSTGANISVDPDNYPGSRILGFTTYQRAFVLTANISTITNLPFVFHGPNNIFNISLTGGTVTSGSLQLTLASGYYTQTLYASALAAAILNSPTLVGVTIVSATVTANTSTGGFNLNIQFDKTFTNAIVDFSYGYPGELFPADYSGISVTNGPAAATLTLSTRPPSKLITKVLYIRSAAISSILSTKQAYNIIHKVVVPSSSTKTAKYSGATITPYQAIINGVPGRVVIDEAEYRVAMIAAKNQTLTSIDLELLDEDYSPINLNGYNWSIAIVVTTA